MPGFVARAVAGLLTHVGSRSSALSPLLWMVGLLVAGIILLSAFTTSPIAWGLFVLLCLVVLAAVLAFAKFAGTNPDLLRSESFSIKKLELERGIIGDNIHGTLLD